VRKEVLGKEVFHKEEQRINKKNTAPENYVGN